jgi:hypothetical protein
MRLIQVPPDELRVSSELSRSGSAKAFEERLRSSIEEVGLAEPLKIAALPEGGYLVIDGMIRLSAINAIRTVDPRRFVSVAAYLFDYEHRYELRYQSDIYQDLLPSQLAYLVEHLHKTEHVRKLDIARYIGVSAPTLRNYTGLWRLVQRGGLFAKIVSLMDGGVIPSSNPFAWLRLSALGIRKVIESEFAKDQMSADDWIEDRLDSAQRGAIARYPINFVESVTDGLPADCYNSAQAVRSEKKELGQLRVGRSKQSVTIDFTSAHRHLSRVANQSRVPVLQAAATSLHEYLR